MINSRIPSNLLVARFAIDIVNKQNELANTQEQISSGKKINRPSDAPAESSHLLTINESLSRLDQYTNNSAIAESQLNMEETAIAATTDALNRVRELALRAQNTGVNSEFRDEINAEVKLILDEIYGLANSKDSFGNYLFSGSNTEQIPFNAGYPVTYNGSDETSKIDISLNRSIFTGDSGIDVFMRIRAGNGDFQTEAGISNTGTGIISKGTVSDQTAFTGGNYEITFTSPSLYDVINVDTGSTILSSQTFTEGSAIVIDGMTTSINGEPSAGDSFSIGPSQYLDVFSPIAGLIEALDSDPTSANETANVRATIGSTIDAIDNSLNHLNTIRSSVGSRLSNIDSSRDENESVALQLERVRSDVEDVNIVDAITQLQTNTNSLEILQQSFSRIEGLSLFDYM